MRTNFVIIFMGRSGSKHLMHLLNNNAQIHCEGEIFHKREENYEDSTEVFFKLSSVLSTPVKAVGFQFRYQRHFNEFPEIKAWLLKNRANVKVVLLERQNKLKAAVSQQNSFRVKQMIGGVHIAAGVKLDLGPLELNIKSAVDEIELREKLDNKYLLWAKNNFQTHHVTYESIVSDEINVLNDLFGFLEVDSFSNSKLLVSKTGKITSENLRDVLSNYDELSERLKSIGKDQYLNT